MPGIMKGRVSDAFQQKSPIVQVGIHNDPASRVRGDDL